MRALLWIFTISFFIRFWFNVFACSGNEAFACDAAEYLRHAQNMLTTFNNLSSAYPHSVSICSGVLLGYANVNDINSVKQIFSPLQSMSISGPVFPAFILICYKVFGQNPSVQSWILPLVAQSVLSALTCVLICSIARKCWNSPVGLVAGLIASFYPGFIVNSGRLYSESFACFLLCTVLWLFINYLTRTKPHYACSFFLGVFLFALQTTRSTMVILCLAIILFFSIASISVVGKRIEIAKHLIAILVGLALCFIPWFLLQKLAFGKTSFIVDRVGQYNFFVGNDSEELGWLSIPYPDLRGIEKDKYSDILKRSVRKSPERFVKLMLDKPARLLKLPWNDFRTSIGPFSFQAQALFHQLVLTLAAIGIISSFSGYHAQFSRTKIISRLTLLFVGLFHGIYLLFITVPRYGLTAMPEVVIFSAVGLLTLAYSLKEKGNKHNALKMIISTITLLIVAQLNIVSLFSNLAEGPRQIYFWLYLSIILKTGILVFFLLACWQIATQRASSFKSFYASACICLVVLFAAPSYCLPIRAHGRWHEWAKTFQRKNSFIERTVILSKNQKSNARDSQCYLALNVEGGSNLASDWNIFINHRRLNGPFISAMSLAQDLSLIHENADTYSVEQESILQSLCNINSRSLLDLRQWYLIPLNTADLPTSLDENPAVIRIVLEKKVDSSNTIYGAFNFSKSFSILPSIFRFSWEKTFYGVENQTGLSDPAYDQKIETDQPYSAAGPYIRLLIPKNPLLQFNVNQRELLSNAAQFAPHKLTMLQNQFKRDTFSKNDFTLSFKPIDNTLAKRKDNGRVWLIRYRGEVTDSSYIEKAAQRQNTAPQRLILWTSLNFSASDSSFHNKNISYISPWLPNYLKSSAKEGSGQPLHFDVCFPILIDAFSEPLNTLDLHLLRQTENDLSKQPQQKCQVDCSLQIYEMNKLLSGIQYEIL